MGLEAATYITGLNAAWPIGAVDPKSQGDDHLRLIKSVLQASFPNINAAVTPTPTILNQLTALLANTNTIRTADGVVGTPAWSFTSDTDTGIYRDANNSLSASTGGTSHLTIRDQGTPFIDINKGVLRLGDGVVGAPVYTFFNDTDTGFYRNGANIMSFSAGGVFQMELTGIGIGLKDGAVGTPSYYFSNDPDTGFYRSGANRIDVATGGVAVWEFGATFHTSFLPIQDVDGTAAAPSYTFANDGNTGIFRSGTDSLGISTNGTNHLNIDDNGASPRVDILKGVFRLQDGSAGTPAIATVTEPTTGIYRSGAGQLGITSSGAKVLETKSAIGGGATVADFGGIHRTIGFREVPQNSQSANYTCVLADSGKHILHPSGGGAGDTFTIPANASVAFDIGTVITFINADSNSVAIAITTDTLTLAGTTSTGSRTLAQNGVATAIKVTATGWIISGTGLS